MIKKKKQQKTKKQKNKKQKTNDNTPPSCHGEITNWRNVANSNPNPGLYTVNAHIKFGKNPLRFTQVIVLKRTYGCVVER